MRKRLFSWLGLVVVFLGMWFGSQLAPAYALTEDQRLLNEVWRIVNRYYVDETFNHQNWARVRQQFFEQGLENREATYQAIQGMLATLEDPFTRLLKPDQYRSLQTSTSGELTGVGLQIAVETDTGHLLVIAPIENSPADRAGLQPADRILQIDGTPTNQLTLDEAAERMRGPIGSQVVLTVSRADQDQFDVALVRDVIELNPVYAELHKVPVLATNPSQDHASQEKRIGYIRLSQFNANATTEIARAIRKLESQGADAYILDLRNNSGGLLQAGIEVARLWLDQGTIVYTVNRQGIQDNFEAFGDALTDDPLVVLVNQGTASASEILAGALQDNKRAVLVGERTFGKGLIQSLFSLSDGSGLAVTVAKYETPNHHDINHQGITPDRIVALQTLSRRQVGTNADSQYHAAEDLLINQVVLAGAT